jgi:hypothetical protein
MASDHPNLRVESTIKRFIGFYMEHDDIIVSVIYVGLKR